MTIKEFQLSNGLRTVYLPSSSQVSYCGFAVNAGSRDEKAEEAGLAHFVEHNLFKGTAKRKAWHILNRMENVGGELNAFTSKEHTCIYTVFREKDLERAMELLADLVVNSIFPPCETDRERAVVLDEIQSYEDTPSELIFDDIENVLFDGHPLGWHILGSTRTVKKLGTDSCKAFLQRCYYAENMVFFTMTGAEHKQVVRLAQKYMSCIPSGKSLITRISPPPVAAYSLSKKKNTHLTHVIIGGRAYDLHDPNRYAMFLLNNILGGPGMNSRLNVALREKHGLAYTVESNYTAYTDTGVFSVYFGTDRKHCDYARELVEKELAALRDNKLSNYALRAAKKQAIGQTVVASDNNENVFISLGKAYLHTNRYETLPEIIARIESVTASQILTVANEILSPPTLSTLTYS